MDVDKMQAGRELDAIVAEKVMGPVNHAWGFQSSDNAWMCRACGYWDTDEIDCTPQYSTDIGCAWEVLKRIFSLRLGPEYHPDFAHVARHKCRHGLYKPVIQINLYEHDDEYSVIVGRCKCVGMDDDIVVQQMGGNPGDTIPLLVCRAALKSVGVK